MIKTRICSIQSGLFDSWLQFRFELKKCQNLRRHRLQQQQVGIRRIIQNLLRKPIGKNWRPITVPIRNRPNFRNCRRFVRPQNHRTQCWKHLPVPSMPKPLPTKIQMRRSNFACVGIITSEIWQVFSISCCKTSHSSMSRSPAMAVPSKPIKWYSRLAVHIFRRCFSIIRANIRLL